MWSWTLGGILNVIVSSLSPFCSQVVSDLTGLQERSLSTSILDATAPLLKILNQLSIRLIAITGRRCLSSRALSCGFVRPLFEIIHGTAAFATSMVVFCSFWCVLSGTRVSSVISTKQSTAWAFTALNRYKAQRDASSVLETGNFRNFLNVSLAASDSNKWSLEETFSFSRPKNIH